MATKVTLSTKRQSNDDTGLEVLLEKVRAVFESVERSCSRFDPASDISRLNSSPDSWHKVGIHCYSAVREAHAAYVKTGGLFDPRILGDLIRLGYEGSWTKGVPSPVQSTDGTPRGRLPSWTPQFDSKGGVLAGPHPIDLGGIGKGLALRWSGENIEQECETFLIEAGGDCICRGGGPEGQGWDIGVQNPHDPAGDPVMVVRIAGAAVCTSSVAVRSWWRGGSLKHHIISPSTGEPGKGGLAAVTVISGDPAWAEIWSKSLFLAGKDSIEEFSQGEDIAAAWVCDNGSVGSNPRFQDFVIWEQGVR